MLSVIDSNGIPISFPPLKKLSVRISWTESIDSSWARALVYHENSCDTMDFIRPPKQRGWFLQKLNNKPRSLSHRIYGEAQQNQDSIHIGIGSFSNISYYGIRDRN